MNRLEKNIFQLDYYSENYTRFENDFYRYTETNIPLTFLTDDLVQMMAKTGRSYFRLNAQNAKDKMDHYFVFEIETPKENSEVKLYKYTGHKFKIEEK